MSAWGGSKSQEISEEYRKWLQEAAEKVVRDNPPKPVAFALPYAPSIKLDKAGMAVCPFCGQRGAVTSLPHFKAGCWNAKCVAFVNGNQYLTEDAAVSAWNRRASPETSGASAESPANQERKGDGRTL